MKNSNKLNYISLFSSAGVGCYGFKMEEFECIATNEIIERRLNIQKINNKCKNKTGYISGDIRDKQVVSKIFNEVAKWKKNENIKDVDVLIATPPCQGISVANHKKKDEKGRNSLIVESIKITKKLKPKFFIYENVRSFLNTLCTDTDGKDKKIGEAIENNLGGDYNILSQVINFKEFGSFSSRTRAVVIGTRKDLVNVTPYDIFPGHKKEKTLREVIGYLPSLKRMGEISPDDIYHNFRKYSPHMLDWIKDTKEGQSAFQNKDLKKRPHRLVDGKIIFNKNKNGDKYTRCFWNKVGPCIHTRNDILASQSTIHPKDNRVFSVRELMLMMSIPNTFRWTKENIDEINKLAEDKKRKIIDKEDINIRQSIGEAVPTEIFRQIAEKIKKKLIQTDLSGTDIKKIIKKNNLTEYDNLIQFLERNKNKIPFAILLKISELSNSERQNHAAYYTRQDICFSLIKELPNADQFKKLRILEPAVGSGNFLPLLIKKYADVPEVVIDLIDIDKNIIKVLKELLSHLDVPKNIHINFINDDFLLRKFNKRYNIVIGNPPFGKIVKSKNLLDQYKKNRYNNKTNNIFSFFVEKSLSLGDFVALVSPKSTLSAPDFNKTRELLSKYNFQYIVDYGEKGFTGVKIETIGFLLSTKNTKIHKIKVESYITNDVRYLNQNYIFDNKLPIWILYRGKEFDLMLKNMNFNIFDAFRDRVITKKYTKLSGDIRVLKSRNIGNNEILNIKGYDSYIDKKILSKFVVNKFLNKKDCVLVPNLTYNPRACFLPKNSITDGSVAILTSKASVDIKKSDLDFFSSEEFRKFYMLSRNLGTRSLNIDSNSVYFFGLKK